METIENKQTFTDHNAMVIKLVILRSLERQQVPGRQIVWDLGDPSSWRKYQKFARTNPSLNKIWVDFEYAEYSYARWKAKINRLFAHVFQR